MLRNTPTSPAARLRAQTRRLGERTAIAVSGAASGHTTPAHFRQALLSLSFLPSLLVFSLFFFSFSLDFPRKQLKAKGAQAPPPTRGVYT